jgi:hypothetical protein
MNLSLPTDPAAHENRNPAKKKLGDKSTKRCWGIESAQNRQIGDVTVEYVVPRHTTDGNLLSVAKNTPSGGEQIRNAGE